MQLLFDIVIPVFLIMVLGWWCRRSGLLEDSSAAALNKYVYYIAVPALMFLSTARVEIATVLQWDFISVYLGGSLIAVLAGFLGWQKMRLQQPLDWTVIALNSAWANTVYMGVPIFYFMFGERGTLPVVISTLASNLVFILVLALASEMQNSAGGIWQKLKALILQALLKNPVMMAPILGMAVSALQLPLPKIIETPLAMLAPSAAPVALFALGISLCGLQVKKVGSDLAWLSGVKLIVHPLVAWGLAILVGLDPFWTASVVLLSALPTGAMVFVLAQQYQTRVPLTSAVILVTTLMSVITLAVLLPLVKQLAS